MRVYMSDSICGALPRHDVLQPDDGRTPRLEDLRGHEEPGSTEVLPRSDGGPST